ncbi:MAG: PHP domain-containing protein [Anaerolineaceae bacterium]|nr:PHP domain-containing protein [Anaerolineaceae bacterium]
MPIKETFTHILEHSLTVRDMKQNIPFTFQVPANTTQLSLHFTYAPIKVSGILNLLTLTLFDPSGWRGEGHRHNAPYEIAIGADISSPGFLPGPIQAGQWTVVVNTHMIMPDEPLNFQISIRGTHLPDSSIATTRSARQAAPRGPGWYRGDLHTHTLHSDGHWDVPDLIADACQRNLDFVTLSDHNTISGLSEMLSTDTGDLLTMGGMELTTFWGHALALGWHDWVDWRVKSGVREMNQIYDEVTRHDGLFIIAHPMAQGDPYCTGCDWHYADVLPGPARTIEIWNDDWRSESNNEDGLKQAYEWLNKGYRLALTAGTDNHGHPGNHCYGYNVVYADELSEHEILKAVRAGHLYLSAGPGLELNAGTGDQQAMMGDILKSTDNSSIQLAVGWKECPPGAQLDLIVDGKIQERVNIGAEGSKTWILPGETVHWSLITVRDSTGSILALTNPIFFG